MIASAGAAIMIIGVAALPALAQTGAGASTTASVGFRTHLHLNVTASTTLNASTTLSAHLTLIVTRANQEISRRINALNALSARVNEMMRLSAADKDALSSSIQSQITALNTLQLQISTDAAANNTSTLKTDVDSITSSYRIFALILPQGSIEAAADRVLTIVGIMNDLGTKFSARIQAAQSAGNDVAAASTTLADFNAKVSDANTQANAATSEVASLTPDNGNATIEASNTAALKDAHSKILTAQQDLVAARADAETIITDLAAFKVSATASTTISASGTAPINGRYPHEL